LAAFFLAELFLFGSHGQKKVMKLGNQETGTKTYGNSTCFPMFPKHVSETRFRNTKEKPIAGYLPRT